MGKASDSDFMGKELSWQDMYFDWELFQQSLTGGGDYPYHYKLSANTKTITINLINDRHSMTLSI